MNAKLPRFSRSGWDAAAFATALIVSCAVVAAPADAKGATGYEP